MKIKEILSVTYAAISKFSKSRLLRTIQFLREKCIELSEKNSNLEAENKKLKEKRRLIIAPCVTKIYQIKSRSKPLMGCVPGSGQTKTLRRVAAASVIRGALQIMQQPEIGLLRQPFAV
ncbi:MAG: hypothetical protein K9N10_15445 [Deltaproteobacteria bacterium]|nr:hypothetical protein [Deltaproteobacteria bacterium]